MSIMSCIILNNKDLFRAERLFSERVSSPISTNSFYGFGNDLRHDDSASVNFNKFISRLLNDTKKYRVVKI